MHIVVFLTVLSILIIIHECGHFFMARLLGVRVERFSLGLGPKLFSRNCKGTEFSLSLIPIGGYVKMAGDERDQCTGKADEFFSRSPGHRALIILLGPLVNYFSAFLFFWLVFSIGYPTLSPVIGHVMDGFPAQMVGLQSGDRIVRVGQREIKSWEDLQQSVAESKNATLLLMVMRDGQLIKKDVKPKINQLENIFGQKENVPLIGVEPEKNIIKLKYPVGQAAGKAFGRITEITCMTYKAIYRMVTGAMSAKDAVTGPIGIFYIFKEATKLGVSYVIYVMAIVSVSLAIFNLLPLPVLDGGHLFLLGIEKLRGKPIPEQADEIVNRIGLALVIGLALFVFYNDFERYGWIDQIVGYWHRMKF